MLKHEQEPKVRTGENGSYPDVADLSPLIPPYLRSYIAFISPYQSVDWYTANLFQARPGTGSNPSRLILGDPVQSRPWEWMEYTGAVPSSKAATARASDEHSDIRSLNMSALSLEHFLVRVTGEKIPGSGDVDDKSANDLAELRRGEDRFYSESVYERDWKEARITEDLRYLKLANVERDEDDEEVASTSTNDPSSSVESRRPLKRKAAEDVSSIPAPHSNQSLAAPNVGSQFGRSRGATPKPGSGRMIVEVVVPTGKPPQAQSQGASQQQEQPGLKRKTAGDEPLSDPSTSKKGRIR